MTTTHYRNPDLEIASSTPPCDDCALASLCGESAITCRRFRLWAADPLVFDRSSGLRVPRGTDLKPWNSSFLHAQPAETSNG